MLGAWVSSPTAKSQFYFLSPENLPRACCGENADNVNTRQHAWNAQNAADAIVSIRTIPRWRYWKCSNIYAYTM